MSLLYLTGLSVSRFRPSILILAITFTTLWGCEKMSLVSPTGSTITLTVNKTSVPINGTAEITAAVIESAGTPVQNGTVVTFTSSFGMIEPREARTEGGTARVTFTGTQSGTAKIGAFSGGAKTAAELEVRVGAAAAESAQAPRRASVDSTIRRVVADHRDRQRRQRRVPCPTRRCCLRPTSARSARVRPRPTPTVKRARR